VPFKAPKPLEPPPEEVIGSSILVVDDERAWRLILETDLKMLGYDVVIAQDAAEALALAREGDPQVAIIDLMLPEPTDGWALLAELQSQGTSMPVIFYTAYPAFPRHEDHPHVVAYMSKAEDRADLYALLPGAIKRKSRQR
jgi:DNA-binding NtrC family response regulator